MHNLTPTQVDELLKLLATGIDSFRRGHAGFPEAQVIINWMQRNAPDYLK